MSVRLIVADERNTDGSDRVAMYDSVTGIAFGPVFADPDEAEAFLESLDADARSYSTNELVRLYGEWCDQRVAP